MASRPVEEFTVAVPGGRLAVSRWPGPGRAVVAVHGITANGRSFGPLAAELGDTPLLAPDLRGRAGSRGAPGPYGIATHAEDLRRLLDHLGQEQAVLVGHSMGAFVAALAAARHPDRFPAAVLVDGGVGLPVPEGTDVDTLLAAAIGPAMHRLSMTFPDRAAYHGFFRRHPAFARVWSADVAAYVDRDLVGEPPELRSSCVGEAVRTDGADMIRDPEVLAAAHRLTVPTTLLVAQRGLLDEPAGLYDQARLAAAGLDRIDIAVVPDTNHYSILLAEQGVAAITEAVRTAQGTRP